jgi:hypothetical protein
MFQSKAVLELSYTSDHKKLITVILSKLNAYKKMEIHITPFPRASFLDSKTRWVPLCPLL